MGLILSALQPQLGLGAVACPCPVPHPELAGCAQRVTLSSAWGAGCAQGTRCVCKWALLGSGWAPSIPAHRHCMWEAFHSPHTRGRTGPHLLRVNSPPLPYPEDSRGGSFPHPQCPAHTTFHTFSFFHTTFLTHPLLTSGTETQLLHLALQKSSGRHQLTPHKHT